MMAVAENIAAIRRQIAARAGEKGRDPDAVTLVVVTKGRTVAEIERAIAAGAVDLGENRFQELQSKAAALGEGVRWHFIGRLQTNKVRSLIRQVAPVLIHSVDRPGLAEAISREALAAGRRQPVLVQVNVAGEDVKAGVAPEGLMSFLRHLAGLAGLEVRGLMTMAPLAADPERVRPVFRRLRELRDEMFQAGISGIGMEHLSMGMSNDFSVAVAEGATIVRVGRAIFQGVESHVG